jgi:hypothetical protein
VLLSRLHKKAMPKSSNNSSKSANNTSGNSNDIVEGGAPKGTFGGNIVLRTYSDSVYAVHIGKVMLVVFIILAITAFVIVGFFYPACNSTQDHGFYSCSCKDGSALDLTTGMCMCLDTGAVPATVGCAAYSANQRRYVYKKVVPGDDAVFGGWVESTNACS